MATRRDFLWGGMACLWASASAMQASAQELFGSSRPGGVLLQPKIVDVSTPEELEALSDVEMDGSWVQILRTFGNPVLEGHFAVRAHIDKGLLCLAMWDLGDRVLGLGQFEGQEPAVLWPLLETAIGRKPDIAIGDPSFVYNTSHLETAHWHLSTDLARRVGRPEQAGTTQSRRWAVPSRDVASRIEPMTRGLLPPQSRTPSHAVWHEPDPALPDVGEVGNVYVLGSGLPDLDAAVASILRSGRMLAPLDHATATLFLKNNGTSVYTPVHTPSGRPLGRIRILTI
jgi:hypothetical protein